MDILGSNDPQEFEAILQGARAAVTGAWIANRRPWQVRMAHRELLGYAEDKHLPIRFLCGTGSDQFFTPEVIQKLRDCALNGPCDIRILIWNDDVNRIAKGLVDFAREELAELRISRTTALAEQIPHTLLVGKNAYRKESLHEQWPANRVFTEDDPEIPAVICFNGPAEAALLSKRFEALWGWGHVRPVLEVIAENDCGD